MSTTSIPGFVPTTPAATTSATSQAGLNGMSASDFMNLMIQQLQQQDPLNPTDSNQLLSQLSQISTLQSNTQMEQSLSGLTLQQSIGAGGNLIGKSVTGLDGNGQNLSGIVTGVSVVSGAVNLQINGNNTDVLPLGNVETITAATTTASVGTGASNGAANSTSNASNTLSQIASILQQMANG